jgi:hypothetical protein
MLPQPKPPGNPLYTNNNPSTIKIPTQPDGEANALKFSQVFHLMPVGSSFVVTNDMFRLNYG